MTPLFGADIIGLANSTDWSTMTAFVMLEPDREPTLPFKCEFIAVAMHSETKQRLELHLRPDLDQPDEAQDAELAPGMFQHEGTERHYWLNRVVIGPEGEVGVWYTALYFINPPHCFRPLHGEGGWLTPLSPGIARFRRLSYQHPNPVPV